MLVKLNIPSHVYLFNEIPTLSFGNQDEAQSQKERRELCGLAA